MKPATIRSPSRRKTTCKGTMDNHKVFCGLIIFLQIADIPRASTYNFSLCNHDKIQEDLLNVLDPLETFENEELRLDFHTCEDAPSPPAGPQLSEGSRRSERAGRLLRCVVERARCEPLRRGTVSVLQRHCPGYRPHRQVGAGAGPGPGRSGGPAAGRPAGGGGRITGGRRRGAAPGKARRAPCDDGKARELMAVLRSYINLG